MIYFCISERYLRFKTLRTTKIPCNFLTVFLKFISKCSTKISFYNRNTLNTSFIYHKRLQVLCLRVKMEVKKQTKTIPMIENKKSSLKPSRDLCEAYLECRTQSVLQIYKSSDKKNLLLYTIGLKKNQCSFFCISILRKPR